ncbi:hypothetical protein [Kitasatospora xanthocidica]|uniref:hypothetical protein n=1 Tax=Kitasatospora xanthocidica TaxID=83382 RepID=UPI000E428FAA|nr:hypothetical protein [Kitasatospora xanthocidica]
MEDRVRAPADPQSVGPVVLEKISFMSEDPRAREAVWADGRNLYDVVPALDAVIGIIGRDLVLGEYSLAHATAHMAAEMIVEQRESTGIHDEGTALLVVRALAESAAATERANDGLRS